MKSRYRLGSNLAFSIRVILLLFPVSSALAASRIELKYVVSYLHVTVGSGRWSLDLDRDRYKIAGAGQITGLITWLINGGGAGQAEGNIARGFAQPDGFLAHIASSAEKDDIAISFQNGAVRTLQASPPFPAVPKRVPVTSEDLKGVIDPLSAAFVPANQDSEAGPCGKQLHIFDGRRRYDATLQLKRSERVSIEPDYKGTAVVCSVRLLPISGQLAEGSVAGFLAETKDDIEIEHALIGEAQVFVPVSATIPTLVGTLHINAQRITIESTDTKSSR